MQQRADDRNNVERVLFHNPVYTLDENQVPVSAPYNIIVRGTLVPQGPQKFSLVVSGPGVTLTGRGCGPVPAPNAANPAPDPNIAQIELLQVGNTLDCGSSLSLRPLEALYRSRFSALD
jgi:hypothetical protein